MKIEERYKKNIGTIGEEGQERLLRSHVAIAGAGGLGGFVLEVMLRAGVGRITIVDHDAFEATNLNRQLLATERTLGMQKTEAAEARAREVNPATRLIAKACRLTEANAEELLEGADVILDCLGNISDRFVVERAARKLGIPMVHAAIAGLRGQVMTIPPEGKGLSAIYGEQRSAPRSGEETERGCPPDSVMAMAALQAHEAMGVLTGREVRSNSVLSVDLESLEIKKFEV